MLQTTEIILKMCVGREKICEKQSGLSEKIPVKIHSLQSWGNSSSNYVDYLHLRYVGWCYFFCINLVRSVSVLDAEVLRRQCACNYR